jgi:heme-degrading monooxygenase HmoA
MTENRFGREGAGETFVVSSEVTISPERGAQLAQAFRDRLHLVEAAPGFQRLEVWQDIGLPGVFQMVSWWDDVACFRDYMRSEAHGLSHARIPTEPERPHGSGLRRYRRLPDAGVSDGA